MKPIQTTIVIAGLSLLTSKAQAQSSWNFEYGIYNIFSPNATAYVVQQQNIEQVNEGSGVSYWCPVNNGEVATLTQEFTFSGPTTAIYLNTQVCSFNLGALGSGIGALYASTDGVNWTLLGNAPTPSQVESSTALVYNGDLPNSLLGANQIYIQAQLESSGWNITSQFERQDGDFEGDGANIFQLDANYTTAVPEAPSSTLLVVGLAVVTCQTLRRSGERQPKLEP